MSQLEILLSTPSLTLSLKALPAVQRLGGGDPALLTFSILDGPLAGGRLLLGGSGFGFDGQPLPSAGTLTSLILQRPGSLATLAELDGFSVGAAAFRNAAATDLSALLMAGGDTLTGASGGDRLAAFGGNDLLLGLAGADRLEGGPGADTLDGGEGVDQLFGGNGNDLLLPGEGRDVVRAGAGDDTIRLTFDEEAGPGELIDGGAGIDVIELAVPPTFGAADLWGARIIGVEILRMGPDNGTSLGIDQFESFETIELAAPAAPGQVNRLHLHGEGTVNLNAVDLVAEPGAQLRFSLHAEDRMTVIGREEAFGFGDDELFFSFGSYMVYGGSGNDRMESGSGRLMAYGEEGEDLLQGSGEKDSLHGDAGNDTLLGGAENDYLSGGAGADSLGGGAGNDDLIGDEGNDRLAGDAGQDQLRGGLGADQVAGGAGADVFIFVDAAESTDAPAGRDRILDFSRAQGDRIILAAIDANTGTATNEAFAAPVAGAGAVLAPGVLTYTVFSTYTLLRGYTDSVPGADFALIIEGIGTPQASDFLL